MGRTCTLFILLAAVAALLVLAVLISGAASAHKRGYGSGQVRTYAQPQQLQGNPGGAACAQGCQVPPGAGVPQQQQQPPAGAQVAPSLRKHLGRRFPTNPSRDPGQVLRAASVGDAPRSKDPAGGLGTAPISRVTSKYATISEEKTALMRKGKVHDLNTSQLDSLTGTNGWEGVVMLYSPGCGHCHAMMPDYEKAAGAAQVPFYRINGDQNLATTKKYGVEGYPTLFRFRQRMYTPYKGDRKYASLVKFGEHRKTAGTGG